MTLTKRPDSPFWFSTVHLDGKRHRKSLRTSDKRRAQELEAQWVSGLLSCQQTNGLAPAMTLQEGLERYELEQLRPRKPNYKTAQKQRNHLVHIERDLGSKTQLSDLTVPVIANWRTDLLKRGLAPSSINRKLTTVKALLNLAAHEWSAIEAVPRIKMLKTPPAEEKYLSPEEVDRLIDCARPRLARVIIFLYGSGCRLAEALGLTWADVDLSKELVTVRFKRTKAGKAHGVPVSARASEMLREEYERLQPRPSDAVFTYTHVTSGEVRPYQNIHNAYYKAREKAGLPHANIHSLRHSYAASLVRRGVSLYTVSKLLGHSNPTITNRYASLAPDDLAGAVAKLG